MKGVAPPGENVLWIEPDLVTLQHSVWCRRLPESNGERNKNRL
jgi:hypothetical protein